MTSVVSDTHALLWYLLDPGKLSPAAAAGFRAASVSIVIPSVCLVEVTYLVERGRLPAEASRLIGEALDAADTAFTLAPLSRAVADAVARVPRDVVPDMPDRIIAATALALGLPLVTRDAQIRASSVPTIW